MLTVGHISIILFCINKLDCFFTYELSLYKYRLNS